MADFICFDLEGPLSPQDNAYDLMRLFPGGDRIFEVISRYDDLLALEEREDYEPGDTLALIVPFLVLHGISEEDISALASRAIFTPGAPRLVSWLQGNDWRVFCISTTYEQYAIHITQKLGIPNQNVASTPFPLDRLQTTLSGEESELIRRAEEDIRGMRPGDDDQLIKQRLDEFFGKRLPQTKVGAAMREVRPVGGRRKVAALNRFAAAYNQPLARWVVVGDSITDARMLQEVDRAGGLAIAFNANEYALSPATMSLASRTIDDLTDVLQAWREGSRAATRRLVREREKMGGEGDRGHFHWLADKPADFAEIVEVHQRIRRLVRQEAGKLG